uniref:Uncharacterized protein n=1 Tax=Mycena chlorophos TaxID=658473 RepID=A0ABQ0KVL1_MYCCL|nr:predicted protein [Mycena chlorophos]
MQAPSTPSRSSAAAATLPEKPSKPRSATAAPSESPSKPEKASTATKYVRPKPRPLTAEQRQAVRDSFAREESARIAAVTARVQANTEEHARLVMERAQLEANIAAVRALGDSFAADEREHIHMAHYHQVLARALVVAAEAADELRDEDEARGLRVAASDHMQGALDARAAQSGAFKAFWSLVHREAALVRQRAAVKDRLRVLEASMGHSG